MAIEGKDRKAFYQMQVLADSAFIFLVVKLKVQKAKVLIRVCGLIIWEWCMNKNQKAPLLLGQSVLNRLGRVLKVTYKERK